MFEQRNFSYFNTFDRLREQFLTFSKCGISIKNFMHLGLLYIATYSIIGIINNSNRGNRKRKDARKEGKGTRGRRKEKN